MKSKSEDEQTTTLKDVLVEAPVETASITPVSGEPG